MSGGPVLRRPLGGGGPAAEFWTVRDQFADTALQELMRQLPAIGDVAEENSSNPVMYLATCAYQIADAMLKAREA